MGRIRSAITGRFTVKGDPATTVVEATHPRPSAAALGRQLAAIADRATGTDVPGEAYSQDPDFWNVEATRLLTWIHG